MTQRITYENYKDATIDDFYHDFSMIWSRDFKERSVFDLWLHIVDHASKIAKAVKEQHPPGVIDDIADTSVWLMSFIAYCEHYNQANDQKILNRTLPSELIWERYPAVCPGCFDHLIISKFGLTNSASVITAFETKKADILEFLETHGEVFGNRSCDCMSRSASTVKNKEIWSALRTELDQLRLIYANSQKQKNKIVLTVAGIESMFSNLYLNGYYYMSLETIVFNLLSKVGSTTQAIVNLYSYDDSREPFSLELLHKRRQRLGEEIAGVFSWLFAIAIKINLSYGRIAKLYYEALKESRKEPADLLSFVDIIWSKYGKTVGGANYDQLKCPGCRTTPCSCPRDLIVNWAATNQALFSTAVLENKAQSSKNQNNLIFISYSHRDQKWLEILRPFLKKFEQGNVISYWDDTRIEAGKRWRDEIDSALSRTKVAILLVSQHFIASDFIAENELLPILERAGKHGTQIFWLPVSASTYEQTDLELLNAAFDPKTPLESLSKAKRNERLVSLVKKLEIALA